MLEALCAAALKHAGSKGRAEIEVGDLKAVLGQLLPQIEPNVHINWRRRIDQLKVEHPSHLVRKSDELLPQYVLKRLTEVTQGRGIVVTGVGMHQMWAAQHCKFIEPNTFVTSGGLGTMGFEVPAALGAQIGCPDTTVWSVCGDGGFQMTMCDIATAVENHAEVKFAILNNILYDSRKHFATRPVAFLVFGMVSNDLEIKIHEN